MNIKSIIWMVLADADFDVFVIGDKYTVRRNGIEMGDITISGETIAYHCKVNDKQLRYDFELLEPLINHAIRVDRSEKVFIHPKAYILEEESQRIKENKWFKLWIENMDLIFRIDELMKNDESSRLSRIRTNLRKRAHRRYDLARKLGD